MSIDDVAYGVIVMVCAVTIWFVICCLWWLLKSLCRVLAAKDKRVPKPLLSGHYEPLPIVIKDGYLSGGFRWVDDDSTRSPHGPLDCDEDPE